MAKMYDNPINENTPWDGDESTGNLPVRGRRIEEFLKSQLNQKANDSTLAQKAGVFYLDNNSGNTLVFADEESKSAYLADQSKIELLLGVISGGGGGGATGEYKIAIQLLSSMYNAVSLGSKGHYIRFTFDATNESGMPTGEPVVVTYKITRGGNSSEYKEVYRYGSTVSFNVDKYIDEGTNIVTINVMGQTSLVSTTFAVTFDVINITLSDYLDISKVYNLSNNGTDYMEIPYGVSGTYTKLMEWYIDGVQLEFNRTDDEILETVPVSRTKTIELSNLSQGRHNLQFRVGSKINGEMFYSDVLYRDFFVYTGANDNFMMGVATAIPSSYGILTDGLVIHDMVQYVGYNLKIASYSPINTAKTDIAISLDNELVGNITSRNGLVTDVIIVATTDGSKTLKLSTEETEYLIPTEVSVTDMTLSEITSGLKLNFTARGRNNNSSDKETWTDGTTTATLTGFQWNNQSGWVNDRLEISENAELHIEYAPLTSHDNGKTIEVEWSSKNVSDENAVLCDLRNDNGTGILITATSVVVTSANNVTIERRYKSDENVRMSIVVNPNRGTNKGLTFIYINGVISGAINVVEGDNYISNKDIIFKGSTGAIVSLKSIRVYDVALSTEQILNNFNLYRDTLSEMLDVYNRNSIYDGNLYDTLKMAGRLPVMIVTGEIPTLENTNDKDTQIIVDIEYINMQDTTRNFTMKNAAMRPQGTSSMGYPKKNFRIYTNKIDNTILTVNGKEVKDKLYSFKDNAIPVDCWCLKADYAESSGTHNVGIARMWGDAFKNAQVTVDLGVDNPHNLNNAYALRTTAQQKAIDNGYKYDVRTTIDGFPILLFYRRTPESDIIFLGKYNFNNDKSTEKVFGFTDIPGFDNKRMQCWELLNNGNPIGLFTDISDFYNDVTVDGKVMKGWQAAFESRYPDTKTPNTNDLYDFVTWVNECKLNIEKFYEEKWEHLDVYKVAGYYCYLMRHGAADQFVKNAMLTSEDGEHFYFILYDNDTINGLNNTGDIAILPTDNRESVYANGSHKFAGYDSVLWNLLEKDEEFTQIVQAVDNALYSAGISYKNAISMFDGQQADKWVERVYNLDAEYKYISPYTNNGTNNLFMLQGDREIHRKWWLSNRYSLYDSLFVSGAYKSGYIEIKCVDETMPTQTFSVKSGYPIYYGYGINGKLRQRTDNPLEPNDNFTFSISEKVNLGDPIAIYGAPHIKELNLSTMSDRISVLQLAGVYDEALGTKLEVLKVGSSLTENVTLKEISGIKSATALTHLDVTNMKGLTAIDLSNNTYLKELKAEGTNIASATFAVGAPIEHLILPETFRTVKLSSLPALSYEGLELANINNVESFDISECPNLSNDFSWVYAWYQNKNVSNENAVLHMDNVDWTDVDPDELVEIVNIGNLKLKGRVRINRASQEIVDQLKKVFGETVFNKTSEFYITAPDGVYLSGPSKLLEGENARYVVAAFSEENGRIQFSLPTTRQGCSIDATSGRLTTTENGLATSDIVVRAVFITDSGKVIDTTMTVTVEKRSYPTQISIEGNALVSEEISTFNLTTTPAEITGLYRVEWTLGDNSSEYLTIDEEESDNTTCVVKRIKEGVLETTLNATMVKLVDGTTTNTVTKNISLVLPGVVLTKSSNAPLQECLYNAGLVAHEDYSEAWELALITADQLQSGTSYKTSIFYNYSSKIESLDEIQYFTGLDRISTYVFSRLSKLSKVSLPTSISTIESYAFSSCSKLIEIFIPDSVISIDECCFESCTNLVSVRLSENLKSLGRKCFSKCSNLKNINIPDALETIGNNPFWQCFTNEPAGLVIRNNWVIGFVDSEDITDVVIPEHVIGIAPNSFGNEDNYYDKSLKEKNFVIHSKVRYLHPLSFARCGGTLRLNCPITQSYLFGYSHFNEVILGEAVTELKYGYLFSLPSGSSYAGSIRSNLTKFHTEGFLTTFTVGLSNNVSLTKLSDLHIRIDHDCEIGAGLIPSGSSEEYKLTIEGRDESCIIKGIGYNDPFMNNFPSILVLKNCSIDEYFSNNSNTNSNRIKNIVFEGKVTIYPNALYRGIHKNAHITIPENVTLAVHEGATKIGGLFMDKFESLTLNVSEIPAYGRGNSSYSGLVYNGEVPHIYFGENVTSVYALINTSSINVVNVHFTSLERINSIDFARYFFKNTNIFIGEEQITELEITSDVKESVFYQCKSLLKVIIKDGVKSIADSAFAYSGVTELTIPESIVSIVAHAFSDCSLSKITIPSINKFLNISENLYSSNSNYDLYIGNEKLVHVILDNKITTLPRYAFYGVKSIESLEASSITSIDYSALAGCLNLKTIKLHQSSPKLISCPFGGGETTYTGRNTYNTGENILYVPQGATGYDTSYWLNPLQNAEKCGFTISYTL